MTHEVSQFLRSVCCDMPVGLAFLRYEFVGDTIPVVCLGCGEDIAGAGMEHIENGRKRRSLIETEYHFRQWYILWLHQSIIKLSPVQALMKIIDPSA